MQINLAKSAGFCFGVKRAIDIAFKTASLGKKVYMLGDIVHNEDVVKKIRASGIKKIKRLTDGKKKILLIRAHGASKGTILRAKRLGYRVIDATCPMVKEIHEIAQDMERKGCRIIIIGDKKHDEVRGIVGQLKSRAIVIDSNDSLLPLEKVKGIKKAALLVQSTQNIEKVMRIVDSLKPYLENLEFFNTICRPTRTKQEEIKIMPRENDCMIIIGSKNSANTRRLYEISKALNPRSYWVRSKTDLRREWFKNADSVGVTAGASTPDSTTQEVISRIKKLVK